MSAETSPVDGPVLALDAASPVVSVAVAAGGETLATRTLELRRSSELLLRTIEEALAEAGAELAGLAGVVALRGPGSFTGLRIGLATALGFHQALGLRSTAIETLPVIAAAMGGEGEVTAAVDALRGDFYVQRFRLEAAAHGPPRTVALTAGGLVDPPTLLGQTLLGQAAPRLAGFGVERLRAEPGWGEAAVELLEPPPLAPTAARVASARGVDWDPGRLSSPIYFRPPAVTLPRKR